MTRIDEEFERLNIANTKLMKAIMGALSRNFDYENNGEAKCEELYECAMGLEKSEFATDFVGMINELPPDCDIKTKTQHYVWAANEICIRASNYKWSNFGGDGVDYEIRVGLFLKMDGRFFYKGDDLKEVNKKPDSVSYYLLEKFMRSPGFFLADGVIEAEVKGSRGKAKHRISELKKDLRKTIGNKEVIARTRKPINYGEATGYTLIIK